MANEGNNQIISYEINKENMKSASKYPFNWESNVAPFLQIKIAKSTWFAVPNKNLLGFEFSFNDNGITGRLELFDDYDNLDPFNLNRNVIESFLISTFFNLRSFNLRFGWVAGPNYNLQTKNPIVVSSPEYEVMVTNFTFQVSESGLNATIDFTAEGLEDRFIVGMFDEKEKEIKDVFPKELIEIIINKYNSKINKDFQINGIKYYLCDEFKNNEMEKIDEYYPAGKTLKEAITEILDQYCVPTDPNLEKFPFKYKFYIQKDKKGNRYLVIYKSFFGRNEKTMKVYVKRRYNYRIGATSNVLSYSYEDSFLFNIISQALECNISAVGFDPDDNKLVELDKPKGKDSICPSEALKSLWGKLNLGEYKNRMKKDEKNKIPHIVTVDLSRVGWDSSLAGRALLRNVYYDIAVLAKPNVEITVLGDPLYVVGYSNLYDPADSENNLIEIDPNFKAGYVGTNDIVELRIYNTAGQPIEFLCGLFKVLGFSHKMSEGNYTTTISLVRDILEVEAQNQNE